MKIQEVTALINLPMTAFRMTGIDEHIELTIDEVSSFPDELDSNGYGLAGMVSIHADKYSVSDFYFLETDYLYNFLIQLKQCYEMWCGTAVLENPAPQHLKIECTFTEFGSVHVTGFFQSILAVGNVLQFEIEANRASIKDAISSLEKVYTLFGDWNEELILSMRA